MKALEEIISELDQRILPESEEDICDYIKRFVTLGKKETSRTSMLIATARRKIIKDGKGLHKWTEQFGFTGNYTSHCAAVGDLLLDVQPSSFGKLSGLPFDKLVAVSRLTPEQADKLAIEKDLETLGRDEIRSEVKRALGEQVETPEKTQEQEAKAEDLLTADALDAVKLLAGLNLEQLEKVIKASSGEDAAAMLKAGRNMLAAGIEAAAANNLQGALENTERLLSIQQKEIKARRNAMLAIPAAPALEEVKTA